MNEFVSQLENASAFKWSIVILLMLFVWFLPVLLALVFNRRQIKLIALASVPAGFSIFAWSAVLIWSVTGKAVEKYLPEIVKKHL